jgi:microcystin-dependent protein
MASNYPNGLDAFATNHVDNVAEIIHAATINDFADAINKIETELGTNPSGVGSSVASFLGGFFYGQVTTAQRNSLASPANGLIIFNTDTNRYEFNSGSPSVPIWSSFGGLLNQGTLASRPAAGASNANQWYFATDDNGGTLYFSNGSSWTKLSPGLTQQMTPLDNSVTTAKIVNAAVTGTQIASSVALAGSPTTTTQAAGDSSTKIATTSFVVNNSVPTGGVMDFAGLTAPMGWLLCDGTAVSRTTYANLLTALTFTIAGLATTLNSTTIVLNSTANLVKGNAVTGPNIPTNTTIVSITDSTHAVISNQASNTASSGTLTVYPYGQGDGSTTFNVPDYQGRVAVGYTATGGHADVAGLGGNEGSTLSHRRPKHRHTVTSGASVAIGGASVQIFGGGTGSPNGSYVSLTVGNDTTNDPLDAPAYLTINKIIKT